jgi:hypothetical protein
LPPVRPSPRSRAASRWTIGLAAALPALLSGIAVAHVAPSTETNNRYLKLQPLGDRVRLAYTIYFGEIPGADARRQIDTNHDGLLDDSEANSHGRALAAEVLPRLELTADGAPVALSWSEVHVGLGTPTVAAGAYSIDLIAWICLPSRDRHTLLLRDHLQLPLPGESELRVDESPGIAIELPPGTDRDAALDLRWTGAASPLERGYTLSYSIDRTRLPPLTDSVCTAPSKPSAFPRWLLPAIALPLAALIAFLLTRRRR